MTRTATARTTAVLLVSALLVACSSGVEYQSPAAAEGARPGGTVRIGILEPRTVAPWLTTTFDPYGAAIVATMCDPLMQWDVHSAQLRPAVAKSWIPTGDNLLNVKLRKDLHFSDGSDVKADDVVTSLSRAARSEVASPVAALLEPIEGWEDLQELPTAGDDERKRERLGGINSPEPDGITVALTDAGAGFFAILGHPLASVVPGDDFQRDPVKLEHQPVCVGPYRLSEPWSAGQTVIRLVRSDTYHGANTGYTRGGRGYADVIEFHVKPDAETLLRAYQQGEVDAAYLPDPAAAVAHPDVGADVVTAAGSVIDYLGMPLKDPLWGKPDVRRAVSLAVDRQALAKAVGGGLAEPAAGFVPPSVGVHGATADQRATTGCPGAVPARPDVGQARVLAERTDLAGAAVTLTYNDEFGNGKLMEAVAAQLRAALGLTVELKPLTWNDYLSTAQSTKGFETPFRVSWSAEYPDPAVHLAPLFSASELSESNFSRFTSDEFDRSLEDAQEQVNPEDRNAAWVDTENLLCASLPLVPLLTRGRSYLIRQSSIGSAAGTFTDLATGQLLVRELYRKQPAG